MNDIDDIVAQLKQKRDELRVQMHLATRELQDKWHELEEQAEDFVAQARVDETRGGISDALRKLGDELKDGYDRLLQAMKNIQD
ncbi:MAG: hypothetical protein KJO31_09285 [Gammaproteobacteria bacterium]|nr:hypothetical protein [Gammaproteobacteria bacterium]